MNDLPKYRIERLDATRHWRECFSCESLELTDFLRKRARKEMEIRASACFVLVETQAPSRIIGYYTLSQTSVSLRALPEAAIKRLPHYPDLGATLIGRLARDVHWRGQNIGRLLVIDALRRSVRLSSEAGAVVVVTDPKDERARNFYQQFGFSPLDERRLFLPMRELIQREKEGWLA